MRSVTCHSVSEKWSYLSLYSMSSEIPFIVQCLHAWHQIMSPLAIIFSLVIRYKPDPRPMSFFLAYLLTLYWWHKRIFPCSFSSPDSDSSSLFPGYPNGKWQGAFPSSKIIAEAWADREYTWTLDMSILRCQAHQTHRISLPLYLFCIS